jgi:S-formylglutathione hydrolase FrmB
MKLRRLVIRTLFLFFISTACFLSACHRASQVQPDHPQVAAGVRMQDVTFHSAALDREMAYRVFLPATQSSTQRLPVVYLLHGGGGSFRDWSNDSNVAQFALRGVILVMPEGNSSYYMNAVEATKDKYEDYITNDLIADVETRFSAKSGRENRAIVGVSMGGFAAIKYALTRPEVYSFAGALSPAIDVPSRHFSLKHVDQWWRFRRIFGPLDSQERKARDPFVLAQSANPQVTPYIYLTAGQQEALLGPNRRFAARLKQRKLAFEFHTKPGGHDWAEWDAQIPGCFMSLFAHLPLKTN